MIEIWKDVMNYEGLYKVSNLGRVKRLERKDSNGRTLKEMIMKTNKNGDKKRGYYERVYLSKDGIKKQMRVHRLVAQSFIPNPNKKEQVNHIDGNKLNNNVNNLEWATGSENLKHAIDIGLYSPNNTRKLSNEQALDVLKRLNNKELVKDIASLYNVTTMTIQNIKNGVGCYSEIIQNKKD